MTMKTALYFSASVAVVLSSAVFSVSAASAEEGATASAPAAPHTQAPAQVCEAAVTQAIHKARGGSAKQVQFMAPKRVTGKAAAAAQPVETSLQGEGRYQGAGGPVAFSYHCTLDPQGHDAPGVILKELGEPSRAIEKPWQADMTNLSPEVCEAAVASAVTDKYARAVNLALSSKSRQLKPAPNGQTYMHGQGTAQKAAGMRPSAFTYRCELNTASGKFMGVQVDWLD
jgi:hypothetical protein